MSLLALERVSKSYGRPARKRVALCDVVLQLDPGELVTVWGRRRSGRSTLLRVASGAEAPDTGIVRFEGRELGRRGNVHISDGIRHCLTNFRHTRARTTLDEVMSPLLICGAAHGPARSRARTALERVDAAQFEGEAPTELKGSERLRVSLACALTSNPRLLLIDEPTLGVDLLERDVVLRLLRSLADEGIAILASIGETTGALGADRTLRLSDGRLHGDLRPETDGVLIPFPRSLAR